MKTTASSLLLLANIAGALAITGCAGRTQRIENRQEVRTAGVAMRQDHYDARAQGRQERREIRSDRADARYNSW